MTPQEVKNSCTIPRNMQTTGRVGNPLYKRGRDPPLSRHTFRSCLRVLHELKKLPADHGAVKELVGSGPIILPKLRTYRVTDEPSIRGVTLRQNSGR